MRDIRRRKGRKKERKKERERNGIYYLSV